LERESFKANQELFELSTKYNIPVFQLLWEEGLSLMEMTYV
jgi:hypothetical protein